MQRFVVARSHANCQFIVELQFQLEFKFKQQFKQQFGIVSTILLFLFILFNIRFIFIDCYVLVVIHD
jgi:hypothetical protein